MKCPYCLRDLPTMSIEEARVVMAELQKIPEFMRELGARAAAAFLADGSLDKLLEASGWKKPIN